MLILYIRLLKLLSYVILLLTIVFLITFPIFISFCAPLQGVLGLLAGLSWSIYFKVKSDNDYPKAIDCFFYDGGLKRLLFFLLFCDLLLFFYPQINSWFHRHQLAIQLKNTNTKLEDNIHKLNSLAPRIQEIYSISENVRPEGVFVNAQSSIDSLLLSKLTKQTQEFEKKLNQISDEFESIKQNSFSITIESTWFQLFPHEVKQIDQKHRLLLKNVREADNAFQKTKDKNLKLKNHQNTYLSAFRKRQEITRIIPISKDLRKELSGIDKASNHLNARSNRISSIINYFSLLDSLNLLTTKMGTFEKSLKQWDSEFKKNALDFTEREHLPKAYIEKNEKLLGEYSISSNNSSVSKIYKELENTRRNLVAEGIRLANLGLMDIDFPRLLSRYHRLNAEITKHIKTLNGIAYVMEVKHYYELELITKKLGNTFIGDFEMIRFDKDVLDHKNWLESCVKILTQYDNIYSKCGSLEKIDAMLNQTLQDHKILSKELREMELIIQIKNDPRYFNFDVEHLIDSLKIKDEIIFATDWYLKNKRQIMSNFISQRNLALPSIDSTLSEIFISRLDKVDHAAKRFLDFQISSYPFKEESLESQKISLNARMTSTLEDVNNLIDNFEYSLLMPSIGHITYSFNNYRNFKAEINVISNSIKSYLKELEIRKSLYDKEVNIKQEIYNVINSNMSAFKGTLIEKRGDNDLASILQTNSEGERSTRIEGIYNKQMNTYGSFHKTANKYFIDLQEFDSRVQFVRHKTYFQWMILVFIIAFVIVSIIKKVVEKSRLKKKVMLGEKGLNQLLDIVVDKKIPMWRRQYVLNLIGTWPTNAQGNQTDESLKKIMENAINKLSQQKSRNTEFLIQGLNNYTLNLQRRIDRASFRR